MKLDKNELPSVKSVRQVQEKADLEKQREAEATKLRGAIARLANTGDGQIFFRWLKKECGFGEAILAINPKDGELDEKRTLYAAMRLNLYLKVRKFFQLKSLNEIEVDNV